MGHFQEAVVTIVSLIVGIAALSVILSPKATTAKVIQASASGLGNDLAVAMSPVTGTQTPVNLSYPDSNSGGFGGSLTFQTGLPAFQ